MRLWEQASNSREDLQSAVKRSSSCSEVAAFEPFLWVEATKIGLGCLSVIHLLHMLAAS